MWKYVVRRILIAIPTLFGASIMIFVVLRILPGDVLAVMFGEEEAMVKIDPEARAALLADLHLDEPLYAQYGLWMKDIATGQLGKSFWVKTPVIDTIKRRAPLTIEIAVASFILAWFIGIPVGIISATKQDTVWDYVGRISTILFLATPNFWIGALLILVMISFMSWFPPVQYVALWTNPIENLQMVVLPVFILSTGQAAMIARMSRSAMLEVFREDYVRTAYAKGLMNRVVIWRHVLRNALIPVITLGFMTFGFALEGSVTIELLFNLPGMGRTLLEAIFDKDFVIVQNFVLIYAALFIFINLLVDLMYGWLDPRIRYD